MGNRPTLAEVAALAEVSVATASKVINGRRDVAAGTRERVTRAVKAVGYLAPSARGHAAHVPQVLVLADRIQTVYTAALLDGMVAASRDHGADVVVRFRFDPSIAHLAYEETLPPGCIGIVAITYGMRSIGLLEVESSMPVVVIDPSDAQPPGG